jgi:hypothetical protein
MTINEIMETVKSIPGATMGRANKTNFVIIPTDEGYAKVDVKKALAQKTKAHEPFNFDAAVAEYKAWEAEAALRAAERASKPKRATGPDPEAQARRDELDAKVAALNFTDYTATDIMNALKSAGQVGEKVMAMHIGSSAKRLVEKGILTVTTKDGDKKPYYSKV